MYKYSYNFDYLIILFTGTKRHMFSLVAGNSWRLSCLVSFSCDPACEKFLAVWTINIKKQKNTTQSYQQTYWKIFRLRFSMNYNTFSKHYMRNMSQRGTNNFRITAFFSFLIGKQWFYRTPIIKAVCIDKCSIFTFSVLKPFKGTH